MTPRAMGPNIPCDKCGSRAKDAELRTDFVCRRGEVDFTCIDAPVVRAAGLDLRPLAWTCDPCYLLLTAPSA